MWQRSLHSLREAGREACLPLLPLLSICVLLHLWTAYVSIGHHHADEHFQILEFANYLLKGSPAADLPWEYSQHIRPTLQPVLAAGFLQALSWLGIDNVIWWNYLLKALTALASLATIVMACQLVATSLTVTGKRMLWLSALFLWFMPYLHVRFTSENWSGILFFLATFLLLRPDQQCLSFGRALLAGILLGLSFDFRFQIAFGIFGVGLWLLFVRRILWRQQLLMSVALLSMIGLGFLVDSWFYGQWVLTPYEYFRVNIIESKAAVFGSNPWYQYFVFFLIHTGPPLGLGLMVLLVWGMARQPRHLWFWAFVPFLIGHMLVGHKELRFLYPMSYLMPYFLALGWEAFYQRAWQFWAVRGLTYILAGLNVAILSLWLTFVPHEFLDFNEYYLKFLYTYAHRQHEDSLYLVSMHDDPYEYFQMRMNFFQSPKLKVVIIPDEQQLNQWLAKSDKPVLFYRRDGQPLPDLPGYHLELLYHTFPDWAFLTDWALVKRNDGKSLVKRLQEVGTDIRIRYVYKVNIEKRKS